jgi:hypothetical protein
LEERARFEYASLIKNLRFSSLGIDRQPKTSTKKLAVGWVRELTQGQPKGVLAQFPGLARPTDSSLHGAANLTELGDGRRLVRFRSVSAEPVIRIRGNAQLEAIHARLCADLDAIVRRNVSEEMLSRIAWYGPLMVEEWYLVGGNRQLESRPYLPVSLDAALARLIAAGRRG